MKKLLSIAVLFICQNVFCQEYKFDRFYEFISDNNEVRFFMLNSSDKNYVFIGRRAFNNEIIGYVFDCKTVEFHYYNISNDKDGISFTYQNSRKIQGPYPDGIERKIQFDYTTTQIDSLKESVKIVKYEQRRKRTDLAEVELTYDKANIDYVFHNSVLRFFSHHLFDKREIEKVNDRLPTSLSYDYYNGTKFKYSLTKKQKINTTLTISKRQLNYI